MVSFAVIWYQEAEQPFEASSFGGACHTCSAEDRDHSDELN